MHDFELVVLYCRTIYVHYVPWREGKEGGESPALEAPGQGCNMIHRRKGMGYYCRIFAAIRCTKNISDIKLTKPALHSHTAY